MPYEVCWDNERGSVVMSIEGDFAAEQVRELARSMEEALRDRPNRQLLILLQGAAGLKGTEARRLVAEVLKALNISHMAVVNARPATRILAKIIVNLVGGSTKAGFFANETEAITWLRTQRGEA